MGEDACIAFGFNLGFRSDLPERWQVQGDPQDGFEPAAIMRAKLEFFVRGLSGLLRLANLRPVNLSDFQRNPFGEKSHFVVKIQLAFFKIKCSTHCR